jgi:hypothetical protein
MLTATTWRWQGVGDEESGATRWRNVVIGTVVSGVDLAVHLAVRLRQDQIETVGHYPLQSVVFSKTELRPQNRQALALLQSWLAEPDDLDKEWWDEFEQDLRRHRFAVRDIE